MTGVGLLTVRAEDVLVNWHFWAVKYDFSIATVHAVGEKFHMVFRKKYLLRGKVVIYRHRGWHPRIISPTPHPPVQIIFLQWKLFFINLQTEEAHAFIYTTIDGCLRDGGLQP